MVSTILAVDLGKYKCVLCEFQLSRCDSVLSRPVDAAERTIPVQPSDHPVCEREVEWCCEANWTTRQAVPGSSFSFQFDGP